MKLRVLGALLAGAMALSATAALADPTPMSTPAMSGPLLANPNPISFDPGIGSPIYVTGSITGLAQYQSNAQHDAPGDGSSTVDLSTAFVQIQKTDGLVQFFVQAGEYSFPTVGVPYEKSSDVTSHSFGVVPVAYGKLQLSDTFSVEAGKLPTLIGAEYGFTTQNMNIERGLLWEQEPIVSRGVQLNYASGPLSVSLSWNDGFYSNVWNSFSGLISYAFNSSNTLAFVGGGTSGTRFNPSNQIYNLIYTWNSAPWIVSPYIQYQHVDGSNFGPLTGSPSGSDFGGGLLASYVFNPTWSLTGRVEYETSSGQESLLLYGPHSKAFSATITPTWQHSLFFIRGELSYTNVSDYAKPFFIGGTLIDNGGGFGKFGEKSDQFRAMVETGIVF